MVEPSPAKRHKNERRVSAPGLIDADMPRFDCLKSMVGVAEGADVHAPPGLLRDAASATVAAALTDPYRRVAVLGGRDGMRRSLGSALAGAVVRFLGPDTLTARELREAPKGKRVTDIVEAPHHIALGTCYIASLNYTDYVVLSKICGCGSGVHPTYYGGVTVAEHEHTTVEQMCLEDAPTRCDIAIARTHFGGRGDIALLDVTLRSTNGRQPCTTRIVNVAKLCGSIEAAVGVCLLRATDGTRLLVFATPSALHVLEFGSERRVGLFATLHRHGAMTAVSQGAFAVAQPLEHRVAVYNVVSAPDGSQVPSFMLHVGAGLLRHPTAVTCTAARELVVTDEPLGKIPGHFRRNKAFCFTPHDGWVDAVEIAAPDAPNVLTLAHGARLVHVSWSGVEIHKCA
jgi:hypothetical protein